MDVRDIRTILSSMGALPHNIGHKGSTTQDLIHNYFEIMCLIVVNGHLNRAVFSKKISPKFQPVPYHG